MKRQLYSVFFTFLFLAFGFLRSDATLDTVKAGSYIINMRVTPQTIANGNVPLLPPAGRGVVWLAGVSSGRRIRRFEV